MVVSIVGNTIKDSLKKDIAVLERFKDALTKYDGTIDAEIIDTVDKMVFSFHDLSELTIEEFIEELSSGSILKPLAIDIFRLLRKEHALMLDILLVFKDHTLNQRDKISNEINLLTDIEKEMLELPHLQS